MTEENEQLAAFRRVQDALSAHEIEYWLFGGWAVDFYAGRITREHDDVDIAVWLNDHERIAELLATTAGDMRPNRTRTAAPGTSANVCDSSSRFSSGTTKDTSVCRCTAA